MHKIIAIETSAQVASVAIIVDGVVFAEYTMNNMLTHSVNLMPMIQDMVEKAEVRLSDITHVAVASGPGSFTGLRIGSATAKGLAHGLGIPIIEVPTLLGLAYNGQLHEGYIIPLMDARRQQVYTGVFSCSLGHVEQVIDDCACDLKTLKTRIDELADKRPILFLGDAVGKDVKVLMEQVEALFQGYPYRLAPMHMTNQRAASVGLAAVALLGTDHVVDCYHHGPTYIRMSQAERELKERQDGNL